jgi:hypothetical protein
MSENPFAEEISISQNDNPVANNAISQKKSKRLKHSNMMLTINTNDYISDDPNNEMRIEKIDKFKRALRRVFNEHFLQNYVSVKQDPRTPPGSAIDSNWVKTDGLEIQFNCERGPKTGFLHSHVGIFLSHYTLIKYELELLKNDIRKACFEEGWENVYISPQSYSIKASDIDNWLKEYIEKSPI